MQQRLALPGPAHQVALDAVFAYLANVPGHGSPAPYLAGVILAEGAGQHCELDRDPVGILGVDRVDPAVVDLEDVPSEAQPALSRRFGRGGRCTLH